MSNNILVKIIMPLDVVFEANATMVNIPGGEGVFGVLPGHSKFISTVATGCISVFLDSQEKKFFVYGGVARITPSEIDIVSEFIVSLEDQKKNDVLNKIASLKLELDGLKENSFDANILNATLVKYDSLLSFVSN